MKDYRLCSIVPAIGLITVLLPMDCWSQVNSGSNGSDGAFNPATNIVINMADHPNGIYQYTSVNISNGVTVTFIPNANNTPVVWLVQSNCVINGVVNLSGNSSSNTFGSSGGPGGFSGGNGSLGQGSQPGAGLGPGGGPVASGNASYGTLGDSWNGHPAIGNLYGNAYLLPLIGGSGGGGTDTGGSAGAGGGGGGAILIAANGIISVTGSINAYGGNGSLGCGWGCLIGYGGGGSGGAIRLVATQVAGNGNLNTGGGLGLAGWSDGYILRNAGSGRTRIDAMSDFFVGQTGGATTRGFQPIIIPQTNQIAAVAIQSIADVAVSASPTGVLTTPDAVLSAQQSNPIPIVVRCSNLPLDTPITVSVIPANGSPVSAVGYNNTGTQTSSTATVMLSLPRGGGRVFATIATSP
jgi:hypothetical protein